MNLATSLSVSGENLAVLRQRFENLCQRFIRDGDWMFDSLSDSKYDLRISVNVEVVLSKVYMTESPSPGVKQNESK